MNHEELQAWLSQLSVDLADIERRLPLVSDDKLAGIAEELRALDDIIETVAREVNRLAEEAQ